MVRISLKQHHRHSGAVRRHRCVGRAVWSIAVLGAATLLLGGCGVTAQPTYHHHFTLGLSIPAATSHKPAQPASHDVLQVAHIDVPRWLAGTAMYYRLAYRKGSQLAAYAYSDWAAPPAAMLATVIRRTLAASGHWQAVVGPDAQTTADKSLQLQIENFGQVFTQKSQSAGVIKTTATLVDTHSRRIIAQRHFKITVAAPAASARGGAEALGKASRQLATKLLHWISHQT